MGAACGVRRPAFRQIVIELKHHAGDVAVLESHRTPTDYVDL